MRPYFIAIIFYYELVINVNSFFSVTYFLIHAIYFNAKRSLASSFKSHLILFLNPTICLWKHGPVKKWKFWHLKQPEQTLFTNSFLAIFWFYLKTDHSSKTVSRIKSEEVQFKCECEKKALGENPWLGYR